MMRTLAAAVALWALAIGALPSVGWGASPLKGLQSAKLVVKLPTGDASKLCHLDEERLRLSVWSPIAAHTALREDAEAKVVILLDVAGVNSPSYSACALNIRLTVAHPVDVPDLDAPLPAILWGYNEIQIRKPANFKMTLATVEGMGKKLAAAWQVANKEAII
jgi:hypothetical protein